MKRYLLLFLLFTSLVAYAQEGTGHNNARHYLLADGAICMLDGKIHEPLISRLGPELGLGYRVDIPVSGAWSIIPGAGVHTEVLGLFNYAASEISIQSDVYCAAGYHFVVNEVNAVFSIGPNLSYFIHPTYYYIDSEPLDARNGKEVYNRFNLSLRPEIMFQGSGHWIYGLGMNIGLLNQRKKYEEFATYNSRVHYLRFIVAYCL